MPGTSALQPSPVTTAEKVAFLSRPESYPDAPSHVDVIQTHMSWVFLTEHHAYKFKKARRFDHLDFSALRTRRLNCLREIALNRRLAPGVYLGILALREHLTGLHLDGRGSAVEWLVHMRRLPRADMLDEALRLGTVRKQDVRRFTAVLTHFYRDAPHAKLAAGQYVRCLARLFDNLEGDLAHPRYALPMQQVRALADTLRRRLHELSPLLESRRQAGYIVEAHGDLRPEHICLGTHPVFIDCLEFDRSLRYLDSADELAFLTLECERLGASWIGEIVFDTYRNISGDHPPRGLVNFYKALRALVRARLAIRHTVDPTVQDPGKWHARALTYLELAMHYA